MVGVMMMVVCGSGVRGEDTALDGNVNRSDFVLAVALGGGLGTVGLFAAVFCVCRAHSFRNKHI